MDLEERIISDRAKRECQRISTSVIRQLQKLKVDSLLSGEDSILKNTWNEICVQIQGERSIFWDEYVLTIEHMVDSQVNKLSSDIQMAIWLQTDNGRIWESESDVPGPVVEDITIHLIYEYLLVEAGKWSNSRIGSYLKEF